MSKLKIQGDPEAFDSNWRGRKETQYNHFTVGMPANQIQLAFRSHFEVFSEILEKFPTSGKDYIETGCGRGTLSSYFANAGWNVTLLDYNESVLHVAKNIFEAQGLEIQYLQGDALDLDIPDNSFDLVTNIGLLEHFEDIETLVSEQLRVLKPNGWFLSYVVPERKDNVQRYFAWINSILRVISLDWLIGKKDQKPPVYRSDNYSDRYISAVDTASAQRIITHGMYPLPMISHSPDFPFSLLPGPAEYILTKLFSLTLGLRRLLYGRHGWICDERIGQAFLVAVQKK